MSEKRQIMHNPPHPGEMLRELFLMPLGLTVTNAAKVLGVARKSLSALLNGHAGISPEMAIRISIAFNTTAESWLEHQLDYDLWRTREKLKNKKLKVEQFYRGEELPAQSSQN